MEPFAPLQKNSLNPDRSRESLQQARPAVRPQQAPQVQTKRLIAAYFIAATLVQLCDFLFPLFFFAGIIWFSLPLILSAVLPAASTTDPQIHDLMSSLLPAISQPLHFKSFSIGSFSVIMLGLFFLFLSSACMSFLSWVENGGYKR